MTTSELGWINYRVRPIEPRDSAAYAQLVATNTTDRPIRFQERLKADLRPQIAARPTSQIVVAETPDGQVVGSGTCDIGPIWFEGQPIVAAHLHSMLVHPAFRQRGVATAITQWRISWARRHYGVGLLIYAEIPQDSIASFRNALKWATDFGQPRDSGFVSTVRQAPLLPANLIVREAMKADYPAIVGGLNQFNKSVNFTRFVAETDPMEGNANQMVIEEDGQIVAGAVMSVPGTEPSAPSPSFLKTVLAYLMGIEASYNKSRSARVERFWFQPDKSTAAYQLIEYLRYWAHAQVRTLYMTVSNPKAWSALRAFHWQMDSSYSVAYFRPHQLRRFQDSL